MKEENGIQLYYWIYKQSFMHFGKHSLYCINVLTLENFLNVPYSFYNSMELYAAKYARHYITNCMIREKVLFSVNLINKLQPESFSVLHDLSRYAVND